MHGQDIGMFKLRNHLCLLNETQDMLVVEDQVLMEYFHRQYAIE